MVLLDKLRLVVLIQRLYPFVRGGRETLNARADRRFRDLLSYAVENSVFYRHRFSGIDIAKCRVSDLPILTKAQMMENFDDLVTDREIKRAELSQFMSDPGNLGKLYLGRYGVSHTSGSQGSPAIIVQDDDALMLTFAARFARATKLQRWRVSHFHRLLKPARLAVISVRPGFYPSSSAFAYRPKSLDSMFKVLRLSITDPMAENIAKLEAFGPEFLTGYASALELLAHEEAEGRMKLRKVGTLRQMINVAEPLTEQVAQRLEEVFGVHVYNEYAMGECMAVSAGCSETHGAHLNSDLAILEVVDENNQPVPAGVRGKKVLLTNLYNRLQPIIRYEIDDRVTMSNEPCPCGRILPKVHSVEGRLADQMWAKVDGKVRELPYYVFIHALNHFLDVTEHQVIQTGLNKVLLRVAPLPGKVVTPDQLRPLVADEMRAGGLGNAIDVTIEVVPSIPRGPSGKVARVKNEYAPMPQAAE